MAVHLASLSTPFVASPKLVPSTKAGFKPWSTTLVRCEPRAEGCEQIETQRTRVEELRREVRQIITSTTEQVAQLELIDSLERLGVAYHFEKCFSRFRDQSSQFSENIREDVRGLLSLYEASQLACEGETVLEEASAFSSKHLRARISRMDQRMSRHVQRALQVLLHRRVRRVEA
ncbi:hypothetical protein EJ110_NYTH22345 [Nymphaea thermarum]|nr:hypothetical protein EJ110_NYTH22345 [Nymphaea thermarum]